VCQHAAQLVDPAASQLPFSLPLRVATVMVRSSDAPILDLCAGHRPQAAMAERHSVMDEVTNQMRCDDRDGPKEVPQTPADTLLKRVKQIEDMGHHEQALSMLREAEKKHVAPLHSVIQCGPHAVCNALLHRVEFALVLSRPELQQQYVVRQDAVPCRYRLDFERRMQARQQLDTSAVHRAISGLCLPDKEGGGGDLTPQVAQPPHAVLTTVLEFDSGLTGRTIQRGVRSLRNP
jgi:hypothetical protein